MTLITGKLTEIMFRGVNSSTSEDGQKDFPFESNYLENNILQSEALDFMLIICILFSFFHFYNDRYLFQPRISQATTCSTLFDTSHCLMGHTVYVLNSLHSS